MRPPLWKTLLSYLHDIRIEDAPSFINPHLYVNLSQGRYQLATSHAIYSFADLYGNFARAFQLLRWEKIPGNEVLILGFGLGSIPYMLENKFHKSFRYTAVEADEQIIYLAEKYVLDELKSPVEMHHQDAIKFMQTSLRQWDLICVDLFVDDEIPVGAKTSEFLRILRERLTKNGLIMYNCLSRTKEDMLKSRSFLHDVFFQMFPEGNIIDTKGNWIVVNDTQFFEPRAFNP